MTIPLDETLLRAETLFHQFQRMVAAVDRKRLEDTEDTEEISQDSDEGIRRRKGKEPEVNDSNEEGEGSSSSDATTMKLPVVSDPLRELLNKP